MMSSRCRLSCFMVAVFFVLISCGEKPVAGVKLQIIPVPKEVKFTKGNFKLGEGVRIEVPEAGEISAIAELLDAAVSEIAGYSLPVVEGDKKGTGGIRLEIDTAWQTALPEAYRIDVGSRGIVVKARAANGLFYGVQTLIQLLEDRQFYDRETRQWSLPGMQIIDEPAFIYRGMHLDVSRHFFSVEYVKKWLGLMSKYKLNTLHWHLTDAGGWRIEIKQYPGLTDVGAWRTEEDWKKWWDGGERGYASKEDKNAYGGYYTQEEIKDVVAYAASHYITVIPEIEMPGHSEEVLAVFPELGCTGKSGMNGELCAGNDAAFGFMENVLTEVMELFPSEYIHVGGDEASKSAWKKCPKCQQRIKAEGLQDEHGLQSYFITRIEKFINSKGRKVIGWDEILEGGLAPDATVMSWRGEQGGIDAAQSGHYVVMTPGAYCYFDTYQAEPTTQPYAIGGFIPYLKVYSYHPVPEVLTEEEAKYILGAQANLWTEYIKTPEHVEYMLFPRLLALSEVVWSPKENKHVEDFKYRVGRHIEQLKRNGVNVFTLSDRVEMQMEVDTLKRNIKVSFDSEKYQPEIRYTTDGNDPDTNSMIYSKPFYVTDSVRVKAAIFSKGKRSKTISDNRFDFHKAIGCPAVYKNKYSGSYPAAGDGTLTDGYRGGLTYSDGRWLGFLKDLDVTIDLGEVSDIGYVSTKFMQLTGPGVYMPEYVRVSVSEDGKKFTEVGTVMNDVPSDKADLFFKDFVLPFQVKARYVNVFAKKQSGFLFVDEVVVY